MCAQKPIGKWVYNRRWCQINASRSTCQHTAVTPRYLYRRLFWSIFVRRPGSHSPFVNELVYALNRRQHETTHGRSKKASLRRNKHGQRAVISHQLSSTRQELVNSRLKRWEFGAADIHIYKRQRCNVLCNDMSCRTHAFETLMLNADITDKIKSCSRSV
jgi:hypothetical protein